MIHHRNRNLAIMQLVLTELERKVREEIIIEVAVDEFGVNHKPMICLLYTSPSPRDLSTSRMPSSA